MGKIIKFPTKENTISYEPKIYELINDFELKYGASDDPIERTINITKALYDSVYPNLEKSEEMKVLFKGECLSCSLNLYNYTNKEVLSDLDLNRAEKICGMKFTKRKFIKKPIQITKRARRYPHTSTRQSLMM